VRVLVVEDEVKLAGLLCEGLRAEGLLADRVATGEEAVELAKATSYDVISLDINLPGIDGFEVCRRMRGSGVRTPVLMLTARDAVEDRIDGLDTGADDYLVKPFAFGELLARLRALARRPPAAGAPVLKAGGLTLDPAARRVHRGEVEIALSVKEFQLLEVFLRRPGVALSRQDLFEGAWDGDYEQRSNVVDVYIRYLREKVDRPFGTNSIRTVRGIGYRLNTE
jgi:two-component system OmpR family response regulator